MASQTYTPRVKREGSVNNTGLSASERETLMKEGRCFYCKEQGHMTRECPKKKSTLSAVIASVVNLSRVNEIVELEVETESDSGKALA